MTQGKAQDQDPCAPPLRFPAAIQNRPALPRIARRIGDYETIREALIYALDRAAGLERWTYRGSDDPGVALLEGAAIVGDVLTFYQDLYANEAYLRTATWRESVAALVRLTGHRLRPGLGGVATLALEIDGDAAITAPAGHAFKADLEDVDDPVNLEALADTVLYPGLSKITLCAPPQARTLTSGETELRLEALHPTDALPELKKGDRLLLGAAKAGDASSLSGAQIVVVADARPLHGGLVVALEGGLSLSTSTSELRAFKLGRTLRHFGGAAPLYEPIPNPAKPAETMQSKIGYTRSTTGSTAGSYIEPTLTNTEVPLANAVDDLGVGATVICEWSYAKVRSARVAKVKAAAAAGMRWGALAASTTMLTLDRPLVGGTLGEAAVLPDAAALPGTMGTLELLDGGSGTGGVMKVGGVEVYGEAIVSESDGLNLIVAVEVADYYISAADVRSFAIHEVEGATMTAIAAPSDRSGDGKELAFYGAATDARALVGRRIAFTPSAADTPTIATVKAATVVTAATKTALGDDGIARALHTLTLDADVDYADFAAEPSVGDPLVVYANLIDVDQGKREAEVVLGSGDARQTFQAFAIPKTPLTYHRDAASDPPEVPELTIYVQRRAWTRVDALFGRGPTDEVYTVREDDDGRSYALFGDGKTGARLPSGVDNVTALYRSGAGAYGALKPKTSVQAKPIDAARIKKAHLLGEVTGGSTAEEADGAREAAPGKVQSLGRLVSVADFEAEARSMSGVLRASARWELEDHLPAVVVTVLMESGREAELASVAASLRKAARTRGPDRAPVVVRPGIFEYVHLILRYGLVRGYREEDVRAEIAAALGLIEND
ncbi:MAG: hypothetical protein KC486_17190, partial [Myxococcales bacterium]|nr:hypothetical protein [Myxococcales bacterium]